MPVDNGYPMNWHERLEIFVPLSGEGQFRMGDRIIDFAADDVLVVDNLKLHGLREFRGVGARGMTITFNSEFVYHIASPLCDYTYLIPFHCQSQDVSPVVGRDEPLARPIHEALARLVACYFDPAADAYTRVGCKAYLLELLFHLTKHFAGAAVAHSEYVRQQERARRLGHLFEHLQAHYAEPMTIAQAARMVGMSGSRFMKFFKQATGTTFVNYVTHAAARARLRAPARDRPRGRRHRRPGRAERSRLLRSQVQAALQHLAAAPARAVVGAPHRMTWTIGTTSYGYRYQLADAREAPPLPALVRQTRAAGLEALQICENARPLQAAGREWRDTVCAAEDEGVALHVGCMTLDPEVLVRYLELAATIDGAAAVRIVLEDESGQAPSRDRLERFLAVAAERAVAAGMTLVLENHFHVPCRTLLALARAYPPDVIAFCVDSANSLRNWESAEQVFDLLAERAAFYHVKDYRVRGSNVGLRGHGGAARRWRPRSRGLHHPDARASRRAARLPRDVGAGDRGSSDRHGGGSRLARPFARRAAKRHAIGVRGPWPAMNQRGWPDGDVARAPVGVRDSKRRSNMRWSQQRATIVGARASRVPMRRAAGALALALTVGWPAVSEAQRPTTSVGGELKRWHKVTMTLDGPAASATGTPNPFLDLRMDVTFTHAASKTTYRVPGFFDADGNAANTGATAGSKWRAHLAPDQAGAWTYRISFRQGPGVAVADAPTAGVALAPFDGVSGIVHRGRDRQEGPRLPCERACCGTSTGTTCSLPAPASTS